MKRGITLLCLLYVLMGLPACATPVTYSADPIEAWIVDADTKQPLEGVIVTANWQLFHSTVGGRVPGDQLMVLEAVTAKDGKFTFSAWGPKLALWGYLDNLDPQLLLFKSGYDYKRLTNRVSSKTNHDSVRHSEWNGRTIDLKPFKGTLEEYARHLAGDYRSAIRFLLESEEWKKTPCLLVALDVEAKRLDYRGFLALFGVSNLEREKRIAEFLQGDSPCGRR